MINDDDGVAPAITARRFANVRFGYGNVLYRSHPMGTTISA